MIRESTRPFISCTLSLLILTVAMLGLSPEAVAGKGKSKGGAEITLIHLSDVHCHMIPHDENFLKAGNRENAGGVAKLATGIKQIREDVGEENSLLFMVGDATHGGGECLFTLGNAIMPIFNSFRIDGAVLGNWDFAYGTRTTRNRYRESQKGTIKMSTNNQTTLNATIPACDGTAGPDTCVVTAANYPAVANNVYNFNENTSGAARKPNLSLSNRVFEPWVMTEADGVKVAFIGMTSTRLPVQNPLFNLSFRFTKGFNELPQDIADARAAGADIVVLATELGLSDNIAIAEEIDGIDILLSGDTHEALPDPILVTRKSGETTYIIESGEDAYLGRIDLEIASGGNIRELDFTLMELTDEVPDDTSDFFVPGGIKALVEQQRAPFVSGPFVDGLDDTCHTFGNGGMPFGEGHHLCTPLDTVAGYTDVLLERRDVIGDVMNNFIGDTTLALAMNTGAPITVDNAFAITNGFRFDIPVLGTGTPLDGPDGGVSDGAITVGELYNYMPFAPAVSLVEFTGGLLRGRYEGFLEGVFDPHPFRHRGGWWMGFSNNIHFVLDLEQAPTSVPLQTLGGRILDMTLNGTRIDPSKIYTVVSCYPHGEGTDRQCRTSGGRNMTFPCGQFNPDPNVPSAFGLCAPVNTEAVVVPGRSPTVLQVAPVDYVAPIQVLREALKTTVVTAFNSGPARRSTETVPYNGCPSNPPALDKDCDGVPDSDFGEVQPVFGAGPSWLGRGDTGATVKSVK